MFKIAAYLILAVLTMPLWAAEPPLKIGDAESGTTNPFKAENGVAVVTFVPSAGAAGASKKVFKVPGHQGLHADSSTGLAADWSKFDVVNIECINPGAKNIAINLQLRDTVEKGYWSWHNRYVALLPGENTIQFAIADLWRGEVLRNDMPGSLDPKNITALHIMNESDSEIFVSSVRLESFPASKVEIPGLKAFKVGPAKAPGFPGFTKINENDRYSKEKGYGWLKTSFGRIEDRLHPDALFRSYISCMDAELAVDVPNGKYRVHLQLEDPGYWEFMQNYTRRTVVAEGITVVDEKMDSAEFQRRYFLNQDTEDTPEEDPFNKYVEQRLPWHTFDVDVADGQLNLVFHSPDTYGNTLSAVVIYPAEHSEKGKEFLTYVKTLRRFDWSQRWKPVSKRPTTPVFAGAAATEATRDGFVLYAVSSNGGEEQNSYNHVPLDTELVASLELTAARGETEPVCFGLRPAKPLGKVEATLSPLKNSAGESLPPECATVWVGRYRFSRSGGDQTGMYEVRERELRSFNRTDADTLRFDNGMARRFWINIQIPEQAAAGVYSGAVTVKSENGGQRTVPFHLRVLPIVLPEPGHLFAMYGAVIMPPAYYPEMKAERPKLKEALYRDLRSHGINYFRDLDVQATWLNGKAVVSNADSVDRELATLKKLGFIPATVVAPSGCTLDELAGGGQVHGVPQAQFIAGWHKELNEFYKAHNWPKPFFCYGDEPNIPQTLNKLTAINKAVHAVAPDVWTGIAYHVQSPEGYELLKTLDVHDFKAFCKVEDFKKAKEAGKFLLNCNVGDNRAAYGLREWRAMKERQTDGCITYAYTGNHVDCYYALDGREDDYMKAPPRSDGSFETTPRWERIREGVDDFRYARALELFAADTKTAKANVDAANRLLDQAFEIGAGDTASIIARAVIWRSAVQTLLSQDR